MDCKLEFTRGNQKSLIRMCLSEEDLSGHEFQMCSHNVVKGILPFQKRNQDGREFLYYDISGTQPLDILLQTQKLKRSLMLILAKSLLKLCCNIKEYALSIESVVLEAKYIMYRASSEEMQFLYLFSTYEESVHGLECLLEYCIDYLDYDDRELADCVFQLYENLQNQGQNFSFEKELETIIENLTEKQSEESIDIVSPNNTEEPAEASIYKKWKRPLIFLGCTDVLGILMWSPLTLLKIFFFFSFGLFLFSVYLYLFYLEKKHQKKAPPEETENTYLKEYETILSQSTAPEDSTQFIQIENVSGMLYNLQGIVPQYICITEKPQLIGKEESKVQIHIKADGVSRIHAKVTKNGEEYLIEDLCSTNGTRINGKDIEPRVAYTLKEGDKVSFAGMEYIFK